MKKISNHSYKILFHEIGFMSITYIKECMVLRRYPMKETDKKTFKLFYTLINKW